MKILFPKKIISEQGEISRKEKQFPLEEKKY
jgi:hypothetical protein